MTNSTETNGSTGPRTTAGKAISSQNAWKSGVYSRYRRFRTQEELDHQKQILEGFVDSWNPVGEAELANVNHLATAHFWRLKFQKIEQSMWVTSVGEMLDVQQARGDEADADDAEEDALLNGYGAREKELARRRRHVNGEYNRAYRELTHLQHVRRREASEKARLAKESTCAQRKAAQESQDRATVTNQSPQTTGQFVSANPETPPETNL